MKIKAGDQKSFKTIFDHYYRYMTTIAWRLVRDSGVSEDLTQDAFVELWKRKESLPDDLLIKSYLRKIVINKSLNHIKRNKNQIFEDSLIEDSSVNEDFQFGHLDYLSMEDTISRTVDNLPNKCRVIFSLSRYDEMSHKEIAKKLNISTKTIENQITIALKRIRIALKSNGFISIIISFSMYIGRFLNIF